MWRKNLYGVIGHKGIVNFVIIPHLLVGWVRSLGGSSKLRFGYKQRKADGAYSIIDCCRSVFWDAYERALTVVVAIQRPRGLQENNY